MAFERSIDNPPALIDAKRRALTKFLAHVRRADQADMSILAVFDVAEDPGNLLLRELELLGEAGLSTREALRATTTTPAQLLRRPDLTSLAPGSPASFTILDANPLIDIINVRKLSTAVLHGRILNTGELASLRDLPALRKDKRYFEEL